MIRAAVIAAALALGAATAAAGPVAVKVVDVAGGVAYLSAGRAAGLAPGTAVRIRGVDLVVAEVTETTAVVPLGSARLAIGDAGTAEVVPGGAAAIKRLARPRPPDAFAGQWSAPVPPALAQRPRAVPLGAARAPGAAHVAVIGHAFAAAQSGGRAGSAEARVIASFEPSAERPLTADLDVAARLFSAGYDRRTRTPVFVRAAALRYGAGGDPALAIGRLRFAASAVGLLDGGRASARIGGLEIAAFGGLVPDPLSGKPDTGASRFGAEIGYDAPEAAWQPRLSLAAHGSTWDGALDERRLSLAGSAGRGAWWLDGWADVEAFASGNPWGAGSIELTGGGASAQWRRRGSHAGLDVTFLRPERSLRLAAALPPEWLCTLPPRAPASEACAGGDWWASATASLGTRIERWTIDAGATLGDSHGQSTGADRSGYLRGELAVGPARLAAGIAGGAARFASWTAGELGAAYAPDRSLELALSYRPELLDYAASTGPALLHSLIADARLAVSPALDLAVSASATTGSDRDALALLATFAWRPLP